MLAGGTDPLYRDLLATNFVPVRRVEVWRSGVRVDPYGDEGLPIQDGSVSATLTSQVTRTLGLTVHEDLAADDPLDPSELLTPYGNELRVFAGVAGAPGYVWPVFRGKIQDVGDDSGGTVTVSASDRAKDIDDDEFRAPRAATVGARVLDEFRNLVIESVPDATFGPSDIRGVTVPQLTWENSRSGALDDLAKATDSFWYVLADGSFVMRQVPWGQPGAPLLTLSDGPGGSILRWGRRLTRDGVANTVTMIGERADGTPPAYATVSDLEPTSPTYANGPFGKKGVLVRAQGATTNGQCAGLATGMLRRKRALSQAWTTTIMPDASLELGDVVTLSAKGGRRRAVQVAASFTFPLTGSEMSVTWRGQAPAGISLGD